MREQLAESPQSGRVVRERESLGQLPLVDMACPGNENVGDVDIDECMIPHLSFYAP